MYHKLVHLQLQMDRTRVFEMILTGPPFYWNNNDMPTSDERNHGKLVRIADAVLSKARLTRGLKKHKSRSLSPPKGDP